MNSIIGMVLAVNLLLAILASVSVAGTIPSGYENINWNAVVESVIARYPRGQLRKLADEVIYRQYRPTPQIARRNFAFSKGRLHTVTVTYDKRYVEKYGIEKLFQEHSKRYGAGVMDTTQAPHMINYSWQSDSTRIMFAYAPKRPDMTVMIYEQSRTAVDTPPLLP